jgi:hypothetical protein
MTIMVQTHLLQVARRLNSCVQLKPYTQSSLATQLMTNMVQTHLLQVARRLNGCAHVHP